MTINKLAIGNNPFGAMEIKSKSKLHRTIQKEERYSANPKELTTIYTIYVLLSI
jgi:hypothetical protein